MLTGGSPGPGAEGTWKVLLLVLILTLAGGSAFLWLWNDMSSMSLYPTDLME